MLALVKVRFFRFKDFGKQERHITFTLIDFIHTLTNNSFIEQTIHANGSIVQKEDLFFFVA